MCVVPPGSDWVILTRCNPTVRVPVERSACHAPFASTGAKSDGDRRDPGISAKVVASCAWLSAPSRVPDGTSASVTPTEDATELGTPCPSSVTVPGPTTNAPPGISALKAMSRANAPVVAVLSCPP